MPVDDHDAQKEARPHEIPSLVHRPGIARRRIGSARARFVPPPPHAVEDCMTDLERFYHKEAKDCQHSCVRALPTRRYSTYPNSQVASPIASSSIGFSTAIILFRRRGQTAQEAVSTARRLLDMFQQDQTKIQQEGRRAGSALRVHQVLQKRPIASLREMARGTGLSFAAATAGIKLLEQLGIVRELTGKKGTASSAISGIWMFLPKSLRHCSVRLILPHPGINLKFGCVISNHGLIRFGKHPTQSSSPRDGHSPGAGR